MKNSLRRSLVLMYSLSVQLCCTVSQYSYAVQSCVGTVVYLYSLVL